ncbi:hypothetical protein AB6A40_009423 [Gnathostoma spinigerum]|uniref:Uncharacterized protein n=1 Tax=Gnathostoma spinigerum TaxID=75299 RepID=A0ABD6EZH9_9BILA
MLFLCGLPMMLMELSLGQYSSEGPLTVWKLCPIFKGIGIGMIVCTTMCAIYYNIINGWALYYFVISIREHLPWSCCSELWADQKCVTLSKNCFPTNVSYSTTDDVEFSADQYFHRVVLGIVEEFGIIGNVQLHLLVALFVAWIIVFAALMKGIKSIGKTVYFTATFPYFVLVVLLSRSLCEEGALDGIIFFLTPKFEMLLKAQVWGDAAAQIFYSTGVCFGGVITLASYNRFNNNLYRDAMIVTFGNSITSILSGFTVFSILGFMARSLNTTVDEVATAGPGLTFIVYPQAVTLLRWSPLWSALFFLMLIVLTLSSMFPMVESVATAFIDQFPKSLRPYQFWVALLCCVFMFLLGIPLTTGGGMYILQLLDTYGVGYALLVLGLVEVVTVAWLYKAENLCKNIKEMTGKEPFKIIYYLWTFITPTVLVLSIIFQLWDWKPLVYGDHMFPPLAGRIGIVLAVIPLSPIPVYIIYCLIRKVAPNEKIIDALKRMSKGCFEPFLLEHKISKVVADDNVFQ